MASETTPAYDRWSLLDPSTIDYGYFSKIAATSAPKKGFYITTAINYTNGAAHMGHAYEAATADAIARYARLSSGQEGAYFVTGADEHGEKIAKTAEKEGKEPIEICNKVRVFRLQSSKSVFDYFISHTTSLISTSPVSNASINEFSSPTMTTFAQPLNVTNAPPKLFGCAVPPTMTSISTTIPGGTTSKKKHS